MRLVRWSDIESRACEVLIGNTWYAFDRSEGGHVYLRPVNSRSEEPPLVFRSYELRAQLKRDGGWTRVDALREPLGVPELVTLSKEDDQ